MITSIPRQERPGIVVSKNPEIIIIDVDDVAVEPRRTFGNTIISTDIEVMEGGEAINIMASPLSIECGYEQEGEVGARGFKHKVAFEYPGDSTVLDNFIEAFANKGVLAIVKSCETGKTKLFGRKCNPLRLQAEPTDTKDARKTKLTFAMEYPSRLVPSIYAGIVPLAAPYFEMWFSNYIWTDNRVWSTELI